MKRRHLLLLGMLAVLLGQKIRANADVRDFGFDGAFYMDVAGHVRDGDGLVTDVSMYHAAAPSLPWPTPIYPVWPTLLGYVARVVPLETAAVWLPTLAYFGTLLGGYALARRVSPGPVFPGLWDLPDAGHLFVATLGFNQRFFEYTSRPYTEGLAFVLAVPAVSRIRRLLEAPGAIRGVEVGAWVGLLFLVRAQMVLVGGTLGAVLVGYAVVAEARGAWLRAGVGVLVGAGVVVAPAFLRVATFADPVTLLRFEQFRAQAGLSPIQLFVATDGPLDWLVDRAGGLLVAFQDGARGSYWDCFGMLQWAPLVALPFFLTDVRRGGAAGVRSAVRGLRDPASAWAVWLVLFAAVWPLSLHTIHKARFAEWNFHMRHALPCLVAFLSSAVWLARRGGVARFAALWILAYSVQRGVVDLNKVPEELRGDRAERRERASLAEWLQARAADPGGAASSVRIVMYDAQEGARLTDGVGYDWVDDQSTLADALFCVRTLGASWLLLPADRLDTFAITRDRASFDAAFERVDGPRGWATFLPRTAP